MLKLKINKNQKVNEIKIIEILFYIFPLSFIIGNLAISLNLLLFILVSLFVIIKRQLSFKFKNSYWLLIAFFLYLFLSTTIQFQSPGLLNNKIQGWPFESNPIFKSFIFVRFLILLYVINILFSNKILVLRKFFLTSLLCTTFVSFDVIMQYIIGFDLFGFESSGIKNSGPFGNELIAGSYLQKFSFFSIFYILNKFRNKNFSASLFIFIITIHLIAILLAGNRMPTLLFLFGCVIIILFIKNLRFVTSMSLVFFLAIFFFLSQNDKNFNNTYLSFILNINFSQVEEISNLTPTQEIEKLISKGIEIKDKSLVEINPRQRGSGHVPIYRTSYRMWMEQPLFGFGLKSFRIKCWEILSKNETGTVLKIYKEGPNLRCSTHSHNYYLELLSEVGIIGTGLLLIFFFILIKDSFYYIKKYNKKTSSEMILIIPILIVFFLEIWPLRSSGSFFTNGNATFFWLNVAILIAACKQNFLPRDLGRTKVKI